MNYLPLDKIFYPKYSDCLAPISVITEILSKNDPSKFEQISKEFALLGFTKVQDLANATIEKVSKIKLCGDSLTLLFNAIEVYSEGLDKLLEVAKLELRNGNFIKSLEICMELLTQEPSNEYIILPLAESFSKTENYDSSIDYLKLVMTICSNCVEANMNLGIAHWKKSEIEIARICMSSACQRKPERLDNWITYADFLFDIKDFLLAKILYEFILRSKNDLYYVHYKYGKVLFCTNNIKDAKRHFKIALKIAPQYCEAMNNLAELYYTINEFDKSILFYRKSLKIKPEDKITLFNIGTTYLRATKLQKAAKAFEKIVELDLTNFSALRHLAFVYSRQNKMDLSVETFKKCLDLEPDDFYVNLELAIFNFHDTDNYQEAEIYLKKCIELKPERKDVYKHLFSVYIKLNKNVEASDIYISLGDLYIKENDQENAQNTYNCAICVNPNNALGHWKVGVMFYNQGQLDLALIRYKKAILLKPEFSKVYTDIAIIFEEQGNHRMANKYYHRAIQLQSDNDADLQQQIVQVDERMNALEINNESVEMNE